MIREEPHRPAEPVTAAAYAHLPVFDDFVRLTDSALYTPLANGWVDKDEVFGVHELVLEPHNFAKGPRAVAVESMTDRDYVNVIDINIGAMQCR